MKTPDKTKKGLACCAASIYQCADDCPYKQECRNGQGGKAMMEDALALIQQLQEKNDAMHEEIVRLQAERDAAVTALKSNCVCTECKWFDDDLLEGHCNDCNYKNSSFKWRGAQKEDSDAKDT